MKRSNLLTLDQEDSLKRRIWSYLMSCGRPVTAPEVVSGIEDYDIPYSRTIRLLYQLIGLGYAKREFTSYGADKNGRKVRKWFYTGIGGAWPEVKEEPLSQSGSPGLKKRR